MLRSVDRCAALRIDSAHSTAIEPHGRNPHARHRSGESTMTTTALDIFEHALQRHGIDVTDHALDLEVSWADDWPTAPDPRAPKPVQWEMHFDAWQEMETTTRHGYQVTEAEIRHYSSGPLSTLAAEITKALDRPDLTGNVVVEVHGTALLDEGWLR